MQTILKRFTERQLLLIITSLTLSVLFAVMGFSEKHAAGDATPISSVVLEQTLTVGQR